MRIAIIGAGLAGLACAHELERLGCQAEIFEQRNRPGKMFRTMESMLRPLNLRPHREVRRHLTETLGLPVTLAYPITTAVLYGPNADATLEGALGYASVRGDHAQALEAALAAAVRSPIHYRHDPDLDDLRDRYDRVIVACGTPKYSKQLGVWTRDIGWTIRGANVSGQFNPQQLTYFFFTRYAGTGYAMLFPFDGQTASVGVGVPEATEAEIEAYWQRFRQEQGHRWTGELEQFKLENYEIGRVSRREVGNVLLIGLAGGFAEPLGLTGQVASLTSGVYAARKLLANDPAFDRHARSWDRYYRAMWRLRRNVNAWTDADMDRFVRLAGQGRGSLLARSPVSLAVTAGTLLQALPVADDPSPVPGAQ